MATLGPAATYTLETNWGSKDGRGEENFKLCPKTVGNSHVMPEQNFT